MDYETTAKELIERFFSVTHSKAAMDFHKFSKGEMHLLNHLCDHPEHAIPGRLSARMGVSTARTAMILNHLEAKGLIERNIDKKDRRKILVTITALGEKLVLDKRMAIYKRIADIMREMGDADAQEFIRLIDRFLEIAQRTREACDTESCPINDKRCPRTAGNAKRRTRNTKE
jgi:DNA-binding MarR family transcriptional regulator